MHQLQYKRRFRIYQLDRKSNFHIIDQKMTPKIFQLSQVVSVKTINFQYYDIFMNFSPTKLR